MEVFHDFYQLNPLDIFQWIYSKGFQMLGLQMTDYQASEVCEGRFNDYPGGFIHQCLSSSSFY